MPKKLDSAIIDLVDEELEDEVLHAELDTDCFIRAKVLLNHYINSHKKRVPPELKGPDRRLKELITRLKDHWAESCPRVSEGIWTDSISALPNEPTGQEPVKENGEKLSTVEHGEAQAGPAELKFVPAPEDACAEQPRSGVEYIFVPDFMKGEALPERLETMTTHARNYPAAFTAFQEGLFDSADPDTAACVRPADEGIANSMKGSSRRKHRRPENPRHSNISSVVTTRLSAFKSTNETRKRLNRQHSPCLVMKTQHLTRRQNKYLGTLFNSLLITYRKNQASRVAQHRLQPKCNVK